MPIHFNLGNGTFNSDNSSYPLMLMPSDAKPVDINGDGYMEIIILDRINQFQSFSILWIFSE
jgi:hypothetical protein